MTAPDSRAVLLGGVFRTEYAWQRQVIEWAHRGGWLVSHVHDSRKQEWGTDPGVPDLLLAKLGQPLLLPELKTMTGRLSKPQEEWLRAILGATGVKSPVWRPDDGDAVRKILTGR